MASLLTSYSPQLSGMFSGGGSQQQQAAAPAPSNVTKDEIRKKMEETRFTYADVIQFSGCRDEQFVHLSPSLSLSLSLFFISFSACVCVVFIALSSWFVIHSTRTSADAQIDGKV
ncbi:MAG: hypothetical protein ACK4RF_13080 [Cyclobacteriaceae bacterium]